MAVTTRTEIDVDTATGLIADARQVLSPNCDDRPDGCQPDLIIIHGISLPPGEFGGPYIDQFFTNCLAQDEHEYFSEIIGLRVSAHLVIRRDGELVQYVPVHRRAWHAGESCFERRHACNDYSVGIELEGVDDELYEDTQYSKLAALVAALLKAYPSLSSQRIVGHSDVSPGRKTDPGPAFDWEYFGRLLHQRM